MPFFDFFWNDEIVEHLAEHGVTVEDLEQVVSHPELRGESRTTRRPCCWGETEDGRYLLCVFEYVDEMTVVPVTAYEVRRPGEHREDDCATMSTPKISDKLLAQMRRDRALIANELPELAERNSRMQEAAAEETLCGHLRRAVHASRRPLHDISRDVGITTAVLCDFLEGERTLRSDVLDRIAQAARVTISVTAPTTTED